MRALPQLDLHPSPAPAQPDAPARTTSRGEGDNFAETLQRRTAAESKPERPAEQPTDAATCREKSPPKKLAEAAAPAKPTVSDSADRDESQPSDDASVDPEITALLAAPQAPIVVEPEIAPIALTEVDPLAALMAPVDATDASPLTALGMGLTPNGKPIADHADLPAIIASASLTSTAPQVANAALTAAPTTDAAPTADVAVIASITPTVTAAQQTAKAGQETQPVALTATSDLTEVDPTAALPPVIAAESTVKNSYSAHSDAAMPTDDAPVVAMAALPNIAATTSATPATQSASMHAVAAVIGDHSAKDTKSDESATVTLKSTGDLTASATAPQPTTPVAPVRAMSETVLAQNALATQGNAMEKAVTHQVTKTLVQHLPNGDRMMVLRLTPPELGTVKIEVIERQGVLSAHLHAEDDGVRLALERFLPSMRQDLRASDAPIRELTLSDQTQFQRSSADGQQNQQQDANRSGNRRGRDDLPRFSIDGVRSDPVLSPRTAPLGGRVNLSGVDALA